MFGASLIPLPAVAEGDVVAPGESLVGVTRDYFPSVEWYPWSDRDGWYTVWYRDDVRLAESVDVAVWPTTAEDVGSVFRQAVVSTKPEDDYCGYWDNGGDVVAWSPPVIVAVPPAPVADPPVSAESGKAAAKVSVSVSKARVSRSVKPAVRVKVSVAGVKNPTGKIRLAWDGGKKTVKLRKADHGRVVVRLPRLAKGSYAITAKYFSGSSATRNATARPIRLEAF
jgi:hypothetical protein